MKSAAVDDKINSDDVDDDERTRRALMYHEAWKWGKELSYKYAGIGRTKFDNALLAGGTGIVKLGRKCTSLTTLLMLST